MNSFTDEELVAKVVASNDQRAFATLVQRHQPKIRYALRQLVGWNEALADDLAQEAFIQAYKGIAKFRGSAKFSSWLYRIAYNQFLQEVRKKKIATDELDESIQIASNEVENHAQDTGIQRKLASVFSQLTPERRSVLHLFLQQQYTQQEIADTMGIPLGTVKTHINRGRAELREKLAMVA